MTILVPVDYAPQTERIFQAVKMVLGTRVPQPKIVVLHIIDETLLSAGIGNEQQVFEQLKDNSEKINEMAMQYFGNDFIYMEECGIPRVEIDQVLKDTDFDLLAFGTKGKSTLTNVLFGSMAQHLMYVIEKPFLIVP